MSFVQDYLWSDVLWCSTECPCFPPRTNLLSETKVNLKKEETHLSLERVGKYMLGKIMLLMNIIRKVNSSSPLAYNMCLSHVFMAGKRQTLESPIVMGGKLQALYRVPNYDENYKP